MLNSSDIEITFLAVSYSFRVGSDTSRISQPAAARWPPWTGGN